MVKLFFSKFGLGLDISNAGTNDLNAAILRNAAGSVDLQCACCVVLPIADCNHDSFHKQTRALREQNSSQKRR